MHEALRELTGGRADDIRGALVPLVTLTLQPSLDVSYEVERLAGAA